MFVVALTQMENIDTEILASLRIENATMRWLPQGSKAEELFT